MQPVLITIQGDFACSRETAQRAISRAIGATRERNTGVKTEGDIDVMISASGFFLVLVKVVATEDDALAFQRMLNCQLETNGLGVGDAVEDTDVYYLR